MTEQFVDIEMTDDEVMDAIASIKEQAKSRIGEHVYCYLMTNQSDTFMEELFGDITEFLTSYRPDYGDLFGIDNDRFYIINEHFAAMGNTADDLVDWLDDIFVTEFLNMFAELADYPSKSDNVTVTGEQLVKLVFEALSERHDTVADYMVRIHIRTLHQTYPNLFIKVTLDNIKEKTLALTV